MVFKTPNTTKTTNRGSPVIAPISTGRSGDGFGSHPTNLVYRPGHSLGTGSQSPCLDGALSGREDCY